eukprot:Gb_22669 [translate_table: standard]
MCHNTHKKPPFIIFRTMPLPPLLLPPNNLYNFCSCRRMLLMNIKMRRQHLNQNESHKRKHNSGCKRGSVAYLQQSIITLNPTAELKQCLTVPTQAGIVITKLIICFSFHLASPIIQTRMNPVLQMMEASGVPCNEFLPTILKITLVNPVLQMMEASGVPCNEFLPTILKITLVTMWQLPDKGRFLTITTGTPTVC